MVARGLRRERQRRLAAIRSSVGGRPRAGGARGSHPARGRSPRGGRGIRRGLAARLRLGHRAQDLLPVRSGSSTTRMAPRVRMRSPAQEGTRARAPRSRNVLPGSRRRAGRPGARLRRGRKPVAPERGGDREPLACVSPERRFDHGLDVDRLHPPDRALRIGIERADRGDLVSFELDAVGALCAWRKMSTIPRAARTRLPPEHLLGAVPSSTAVSRSVEIEPLADPHARAQREKGLGSRKGREERPRRGDQEVPASEAAAASALARSQAVRKCGGIPGTGRPKDGKAEDPRCRIRTFEEAGEGREIARVLLEPCLVGHDEQDGAAHGGAQQAKRERLAALHEPRDGCGSAPRTASTSA